MARAARQWWPIPACLAGGVVAQELLLASRFDVGGHAAEHLGSASAPFLAAALLAILFWATPAALRQIDIVVAAGAWFAGSLLVLAGNLRVINDLVEAGQAQTPTSAVPDIADHSLANSSVWYAVAAALILVGSLRWRRHIGNAAACGAAAAMIFPPWILPGAGVVVLTIARCLARNTPNAAAGGWRPPRRAA
ncbi:MAG: hypothetical protein ACKVWR_04140 [Acidimicrobiales bacterium]